MAAHGVAGSEGWGEEKSSGDSRRQPCRASRPSIDRFAASAKRIAQSVVVAQGRLS